MEGFILHLPGTINFEKEELKKRKRKAWRIAKHSGLRLMLFLVVYNSWKEKSEEAHTFNTHTKKLGGKKK